MLVAAAPVGPVQHVLAVLAGRRDNGTAQQPKQFGDGDGDHRGGGAVSGVLVAFEGDGDGEDDVGEEAQRFLAVPGGAAGDLVFDQAGGVFVVLVVLVD